MIIFAKYLLLTAAFLGGLTVVGMPVRRLLDDGDTPAAVPAPIVGMVVVQVVTWYWFQAGGSGVFRPALALVLLGAAGCAAQVLPRLRRPSIDRRRMVVFAGSMVAALLVIALNFSAVFRLNYLTTADTVNNDAISYAMNSQHLVRTGFDDPGQVEGYDLGRSARSDAFGTSTLLASLASLTGLPTWKVNNVVLFGFIALAVYSVALLVRELLPGRDLLAVGVSAAVSGTLLTVYIAMLFFLGQLMGMAVLPLLAIVGLRAAGPMSRGARVRAAGAGCVVFLCLLSHYQHMAVLAPPVIAPAIVLASSEARLRLGDLLRRSWRAVGTIAAAGAAACVAVPTWLVLGYETTVLRKDVVAGYPLPGFTPIELAGFMRQIRPRPSLPRYGWSAVVIAVLVLALLVIRRVQPVLARFAAGAVAATAASYALIFWREGGPTYRQWKWITFFNPLALAVALACVLVALRLIKPKREPVLGAMLAASALTAYTFAVNVNTGDQPGTGLRDERQFFHTTNDHADLARLRTMEGTEPLYVDLNPYWDSMWAAYFLPDRRVRLLRPTYYAITPPAAGWWLVPADARLSGPAVQPLNEAYSLIKMTLGDTSAVSDGWLAADIRVDLGRADPFSPVVTGTATITNVGAASWLPPQSEVGPVNLGVRVRTSDDAPVTDWIRTALAPQFARPLPPGTTVTVPFTIPRPPTGSYRVEFDLVAEGVRWFESGTVVSLDVP